MFSKRQILAGAAAAAIGGTSGVPPALSADADPIFAAIEAHREAIRAWNDALHVEQRHPWQQLHFAAIAAWKAGVGDDPFPVDEPEKPQDFLDAEEHAKALGDRESDAADELVATMPTTLAGALAVVRYVIAYYEEGHELLDDNALLNFVETIGDAIENALRGTQQAAR
jgi:hypothetical protein